MSEKIMKDLIFKPLLKGALVAFPVLVTVWVLWSLVKWIDDLGKMALKPFLLDHLIFPGSGLIIMIIILVLVGWMVRVNYISWFFRRVEKSMLKFPLIKTVYSAFKDLAGMFDNSQQKKQQVVLVDMRDSGLGFVVGMITNTDLPQAIQSAAVAFDANNPKTESKDNNLVAVYLPMSYMVGGYTLFTTRDKIETLDWSFEEAMRFALTAGVSQKPESFADKIAKK